MHAIAFDFDGTLVDTEPVHEQALAAACRPFGVPVEHGSTIGLADEDVFAMAFAAAGRTLDPRMVPDLLRAKTIAYAELVGAREITVYPGAVDLLRAAAARGPVGICTAAVRGEVDAVLHRLGIADALTAIVTADDVTANKPHPDGYALVAARLGVDPSRCIAIEDSPRGVRAAVDAGMFVVAVTHTTPRERLAHAHEIRDAIADIRIEDLMRLCKKHNAPARESREGVGGY